MTLYELTQEYANLLAMAEDEDLDEQTLADTFEGLEGEIEDKADGYAKVIAELKMQGEGLQKEIDRLTKMKKSLEGNIERMKKTLEFAMIATGKKKFKTPLFSFWIQKNTPSLKLDVVDEAVPAKYHIPQPDKIDREAIKKDLKNGADIDWAHMEQSESIRIR